MCKDEALPVICTHSRTLDIAAAFERKACSAASRIAFRRAEFAPLRMLCEHHEQPSKLCSTKANARSTRSREALASRFDVPN